MTEYMLAPKGQPTREQLADLRTMLDSNQLDAYRVRGNGTLRPVKLAPVGSTNRDTAEWIFDQVEDGLTVTAVARDLFVSEPTVRRFLESLELTEQIEAGEWDEVWAETNDLDYQPKPDEMTTEELAVAAFGADSPVAQLIKNAVG